MKVHLTIVMDKGFTKNEALTMWENFRNLQKALNNNNKYHALGVDQWLAQAALLVSCVSKFQIIHEPPGITPIDPDAAHLN